MPTLFAVNSFSLLRQQRQ